MCETAVRFTAPTWLLPARARGCLDLRFSDESGGNSSISVEGTAAERDAATAFFVVFGSCRGTDWLLHLNPFSTAVPFWGQTTQIQSSGPPKRDCGSSLPSGG